MKDRSQDIADRNRRWQTVNNDALQKLVATHRADPEWRKQRKARNRRDLLLLAVVLGIVAVIAVL